ncbi:MAG: ketopantoate reductase family protein [Firmicutes bacterium]|nr:ketopantoate reductase family protein [Bacillota bacterium]
MERHHPPLAITILGTGAMGRYWAYRLRSAHPLVVGTVPPPYEVFEGRTKTLLIPPYSPWQAAPPSPPDVVVLAIKWREMGQALDWLQRHAPSSIILSLMNGMGQEEALCPLTDAVLLPGTTTAAATRQDDKAPAIRIQSHGLTVLPALAHHPGVQQLMHLSQLHHWGWSWVAPQDALAQRWLKLLQNSVINPLTTLADCPNGEVLHHPIWRLAGPLLAEGEEVARRRAVLLPPDLLASVAQLAQDTQHNLSSMVQDVRAGQETEIEAINGYLIRIAELEHIPVPTHQAVRHLVRQLERHAKP